MIGKLLFKNKHKPHKNDIVRGTLLFVNIGISVYQQYSKWDRNNSISTKSELVFTVSSSSLA